MFKALKPNMNFFLFLVSGIMLFPPIEHTSLSSKFNFLLMTPAKSELDLDVIFFELILAFAVSVLVRLIIKKFKNRKNSFSDSRLTA
jgi:hypothetical protein